MALAADMAQTAVELAAASGSPRTEAEALNAAAMVAVARGAPGDALPLAERAHRLPSGDRDKDIEILSLRHQLAVVQRQVRAGNAALPLVCAYDVFEQTWSPPMPFLFQRRYGTEDRPLTRSYIRECLVATSKAAQITAADRPLQWRPHDFRRIFVTDAIRSGLPPHIAAKICGHSTVDTTVG